MVDSTVQSCHQILVARIDTATLKVTINTVSWVLGAFKNLIAWDFQRHKVSTWLRDCLG